MVQRHPETSDIHHVAQPPPTRRCTMPAPPPPSPARSRAATAKGGSGSASGESPTMTSRPSVPSRLR